MSNVVTLNLNNIKQLIDLNKDKVNFELDFQVESMNGVPFEALVVTQEMLDSETPLEYQKANGVISGKIVSDKNIYQNYFLILKSDTPVECKVMTNMKDIEPNLNQPLPPPQQQGQPTPQQRQSMQIPPPRRRDDETDFLKDRQNKKKNSWFTLRNLCFVILGLVIIFLVWYFFFYKPSLTEPEVKQVADGNNIIAPLQPMTTFVDSDDLSRKISSKIEEGITSKINELGEGFNSKVAANISREVDVLSHKIENKLNHKVDGLSENLNNKVDGLTHKIEDKLTAKVDGLSDTFNHKVEGLSSNFNDKVEGLTSNLNSKVDGLSSNFNEKVEGLTSNLNNKVDGLGSSMNGKISELKEEITDGLTSNIKNNIGEIKTQLEKIKTQSAKTDSSLKSESVLKKIKDFKITQT